MTRQLLRTVPDDDLYACWAALVAYVEDVHQPQYMLTRRRWAAAERLLAHLNRKPRLSVGERLLFNALGTMLDEFDPPDLNEQEWRRAEALLATYNAAVEARR